MFKLSIIVPVYNSELTIARCLESIIKAYNPSYEIIIVDSKSIDSTQKISVDLLTRNNCKFRYLFSPYCGAAAQRSYGIKHSNSEFLTFVDSDDTIASNLYKIIFDNNDFQKTDLFIFKDKRVNDSSNQIDIAIYPFDSFYVKKIKIHKIEKKYGFSCWNKIVRREIAFKLIETYNRNINFTSWEDSVFTLSAFYFSKTIICSNLVGYNYFENAFSSTKKVLINDQTILGYAKLVAILNSIYRHGYKCIALPMAHKLIYFFITQSRACSRNSFILLCKNYLNSNRLNKIFTLKWIYTKNFTIGEKILLILFKFHFFSFAYKLCRHF